MPSKPESERWATYAAAWLPLLIYALSAAGHGYWLDSPEFTAAAIGLDIPHPPGHPLFALWSKPFTWLPLREQRHSLEDVGLARAILAGQHDEAGSGADRDIAIGAEIGEGEARDVHRRRSMLAWTPIPTGRR